MNANVKPEIVRRADLLLELATPCGLAWPVRVAEFESAIRELPGVKVGKETEDWCPVSHRFEGGFYYRELTSPPGVLAITKTHRRRNSFVLLEGKINVWTEAGVQYLEAPAYGTTLPGTKRVIFPHTHVRFLTIHELEEMDIDAAEAAIFADTYDQLENPT